MLFAFIGLCVLLGSISGLEQYLTPSYRIISLSVTTPVRCMSSLPRANSLIIVSLDQLWSKFPFSSKDALSHSLTINIGIVHLQLCQ